MNFLSLQHSAGNVVPSRTTSTADGTFDRLPTNCGWIQTTRRTGQIALRGALPGWLQGIPGVFAESWLLLARGCEDADPHGCDVLVRKDLKAFVPVEESPFLKPGIGHHQLPD